MARARTIVALSCFLMLFGILLLANGTAAGWTHWGSWSRCSASCDRGQQIRHRRCLGSNLTIVGCQGSSKQHKSCHVALCPSYLGWPRIHFFGKFHVNDPTANNVRCFFDNDRFCPTCGTYREIMAAPSKNMVYNYTSVSHMPVSANPMGNGHFHFISTGVTSTCWDPKKQCTLRNGLNGRTVEGKHHARMVDLDPDWQNAPEVIGYHLVVEGAFKAKMLNTAIIHNTERLKGIGDSAMSPSLKSKLVDVEWLDENYKKKFKMAKSLSINFVIDAFRYNELSGRLTGTIGMTSSDDPVNTFAGRVMRPFHPAGDNGWEVPFYVSYEHKKIVLDLSVMVKSDIYGDFSKSTLKHVDIAVLKSPTVCPSINKKCFERALKCKGYDFFLVTQGGTLDFLTNLKWYRNYGGVAEVSIDWASPEMVRSIANSRLAVVNRSTTIEDLPFKSRKLAYTLCGLLPRYCWFLNGNADEGCHVVALEDEMGINFKPMGRFTNRLARGQKWEIPSIASSFGRPLKGAKLQLRLLEKSHRVTTCHSDNPCSPYLSWPKEPIKLTGPVVTDMHGMANLSVEVTRNIGHPRKCGMDGQIYPMGIVATFTNLYGRTLKIGDGGMFMAYSNFKKLLSDCSLHKAYGSFQMALKVFSSLSPTVMKKTCPKWEEDIRPIFQFYYNMFPVMAKHDIINLRSIESVRRKIHLVNMSMFEYGWDHPNFMPTTRDLSPDKTELVRRWIECEVNGPPKSEKPKVNKYEAARAQVCGTSEHLRKTVARLQENFQTALLLELYTIPPYLTALFSLKRDRFKHASKVLKSISTEEMLHMSLAANILNAIGGKPNLTNAGWVPSYPTPFPSRDFYEIRPDLMLKLEPYSTALIKEVFTEVEKPAPIEIINTLNSIALLWHIVPSDDGGRWRKNASKTKKKYSDVYFEDREDDDDEVTESGGPSWYDIASRATQTNKFHRWNATNFWSRAFRYATNLLEQPYIADVYTIGGYYAHAMLELIQAESCVKLNSTNATVFTGDPKRQLTHRQWYVTKRRSSAILFPVRGLKSALEAGFEVVYEGEGGSPCSPFVTTPTQTRDLVMTSLSEEFLDPYRTELAPHFEKSHYVKFQELVHGRELVMVRGNPPEWSDVECLPAHETLCGCTKVNSTTCWRFCFAGRSVSFQEGVSAVWPIWHLPYEQPVILNRPPRRMNERTAVLRKAFNLQYTDMLTCLEETMNGNIGKMPTCMGRMYELLDAGKKLVTQPLYHNGDPYIGPNASPEWKFLRGHFKLDGDMSYATTYTGPKFC